MSKKMIPLFKVYMSKKVIKPLEKVMLSGYIGQGPKVDEFEKKLAPWFENDRVLTLNCCTSALHLALHLSGVGPGDEVISTPMTCTATNEPIMAQGGKIVWADIDPTTGNIDPNDVERKITSKTKAIMVVHWGGYPCDLNQLNDIARKHNVKLIEDAAHAFGAMYRGRKIGCHSDFVCFSFQAIKHLTSVDGGALVCLSPKDYHRGKLLRWMGIDRAGERRDFRCEEDIAESGYKFHMNDVNATVGMANLEDIDEIVEKHQDNGRYYHEHLKGLPGIQTLDYKDDRNSAQWLYTLLADPLPRFMEYMNEKGIQVSPVHARNDKHTMMREFVCDLPGVDEFSKKQVSIPTGWWLSEEDRGYIVDCIREFSEQEHGSKAS